MRIDHLVLRSVLLQCCAHTKHRGDGKLSIRMCAMFDESSSHELNYHEASIIIMQDRAPRGDASTQCIHENVPIPSKSCALRVDSYVGGTMCDLVIITLCHM